jgi:peptidoglycan/LPS O-acetylase OafA/YrhL
VTVLVPPTADDLDEAAPTGGTVDLTAAVDLTDGVHPLRPRRGPAPAAAGSPSPAPVTPLPPLRHVRALDGLRGVAVLAVVVYHLDRDWLPGGFLGVSLFFTLSGFLITNLLLAEATTTGRVDLRRFWARRFRRLLPAALAGLVLVVALTALAGEANQLAALGGDVTASLAYVANWHFVLSGDAYGATFEAPSPALHLWSLSIEEQFYVVLALVAVAVTWWTRRRRTPVTAASAARTWGLVLGTAATASVVAGLVVFDGTNTDRAYFGTDTRAFELLAGALLAVLVGMRVPARALRALGGAAPVVVTGAAVVAFGALLVVGDTSSPWLYRGGLWAMALVSCALLLGAIHDDGPLARVLRVGPLVGLGLISYGVYVYHWPIFLWLTPERTGLDGALLAVVRLGVTLAVAVVSYRLLEQPIRRGTLRAGLPRLALVAGLTVVGLVVGATALGDRADARAVVAADPGLTLSLPDGEPAEPAEAAPTTTSTTLPPPPLERVLFLGDSILHQAFPTIADRLATVGVTAQAIGGPGEHLFSDDRAWLDELRVAVGAFDPDLVVLESCCGWGSEWRPERHVASDGRELQADSPESWAEWARVADEATTIAGAGGARVVWTLGPPATSNGFWGPIDDRIRVANEIYTDLAACRPGTGLLDWRVMGAPDGSFTWYLPGPDGAPVQVRMEDGLHFTPAGQAALAEHTRTTLADVWREGGGRPRAPSARVCGP